MSQPQNQENHIPQAEPKQTAKSGISGELRVGVIGKLYYETVLQEKMPRQLDLLDGFFPNLFIEEVPSDGNTKIDAEFDDQNFLIHAVKYHGHYYVGGSKRVTQILGRLIGTAKGSQEKERNTAERLQDWAADIFIASPDALQHMRDLNTERILALTDEQLGRFVDSLSDYINALVEHRKSQTFDEQHTELFPIGDEVLEIILRNVAYQWEIGTYEAFGNVLTWLLLGALLRNQLSRVDAKYLSTFEPRTPKDDARITHEAIARHGSYYDGDDLDNRFPGIEWYCDRCGEHLNDQPGFDDHRDFWTCTKCGYKNPIRIDQIYNCEMEYQNGSAPVDKEDFFRALKERTDELNRK